MQCRPCGAGASSSFGSAASPKGVDTPPRNRGAPAGGELAVGKLARSPLHASHEPNVEETSAYSDGYPGASRALQNPDINFLTADPIKREKLNAPKEYLKLLPPAATVIFHSYYSSR